MVNIELVQHLRFSGLSVFRRALTLNHTLHHRINAQDNLSETSEYWAFADLDRDARETGPSSACMWGALLLQSWTTAFLFRLSLAFID